eukprot:INCI8228.2.p2 GENE.INCI8228.2~~INCI8228.2.p2  ORF type:complete len:193 (-),score=26.86 INCI8228.2:560-1138(-)
MKTDGQRPHHQMRRVEIDFMTFISVDPHSCCHNSFGSHRLVTTRIDERVLSSVNQRMPRKNVEHGSDWFAGAAAAHIKWKAFFLCDRHKLVFPTLAQNHPRLLQKQNIKFVESCRKVIQSFGFVIVELGLTKSASDGITWQRQGFQARDQKKPAQLFAGGTHCVPVSDGPWSLVYVVGKNADNSMRGPILCL